MNGIRENKIDLKQRKKSYDSLRCFIISHRVLYIIPSKTELILFSVDTVLVHTTTSLRAVNLKKTPNEHRLLITCLSLTMKTIG